MPCLLTLPVAGWSVLLAIVAGTLGCFDSCTPGTGLITAIGVTEFILAAAMVVLLIAGLALPAVRLVLRRVSWIGCLLAYLCLGGLYGWLATHP